MANRAGFYQNSVLVAIVAIAVAVPWLAKADPWTSHSSRLPFLSKQVETFERDIRELLAQKKHTDDHAKVAEIMRTLAAKHKELEKAHASYAEEREHVRFSHPEHSDIMNRKYERVDVKSIEELESEVGLDGRLDRIKSRTLTTFPIPVKKAEPKRVVVSPIGRRQPASIEPDAETQKIKLVK